MEHLYSYKGLAMVSVFLLLITTLYLATKRLSQRDFWIVMTNVHYLGQGLYRIEGFRGGFKLDTALLTCSGFSRWRSAFINGAQDFYGPIVFDDMNKTFMPVNPDDSRTLDRMSDIKSKIDAGELTLPVSITTYRRVI